MPMSLRTQVVVPFALFALLGCGDDATTKVVDSTGLEAQRVCSDDDCETELTAVSSCGDDVVLLGGVDFLVLCTSVRDAVFNENCRPVVCGSDTDCPQPFAKTSYRCVDGLCSEGGSSSPLTLNEVYALCLRDESREKVCRTSQEVPQSEIVDVILDACPSENGIPPETCAVPEQCAL